MKQDYVYEIVDGRTVPADQKLGPIARVSSSGASIIVHCGETRRYAFDATGDDDAFEDYPTEGRLVLHTEQGPITCLELRRGNFSELAPFLDGVPEFKTDADLQAYFRAQLE